MKLLNYSLKLFLLGLMVVSCNSEMKEDAKNAAKLQCELQKILNDSTGNSTFQKSEELGKEIKVLREKIEKNYSSDSDKENFQKELAKATLETECGINNN